MNWPPPPQGPADSERLGRRERPMVATHDFHRSFDDHPSHGSETMRSGDGVADHHGDHPSGLVITDVQVRPVTNNDRLRAWVTITFNDAFVIKGIRIIQGHTRLFVAMPSRQQKDGTFQDVAHPITPDFRDYLERLIVGTFNRLSAHAVQDG